MESKGLDWPGPHRRDTAGMEVKAWRSEAGTGEAQRGAARQAGHRRRRWDRRGPARHGMAWQAGSVEAKRG